MLPILAGRVPPKVADYTEGIWTPAWTGLTVVGAPTYSGGYTRIGRLIIWLVIITAGGANTTSSTFPTTFINNLPFVVRQVFPTVTAYINTTGVFGSGINNVGTTNAYTPTWAATNSNINITGWYEV